MRWISGADPRLVVGIGTGPCEREQRVAPKVALAAPRAGHVLSDVGERVDADALGLVQRDDGRGQSAGVGVADGADRGECAGAGEPLGVAQRDTWPGLAVVSGCRLGVVSSG